MLAEAETFRFDGSDLMPAAVGAGTFWSGVLDYVSGIPLDTVLESIEASAADATRSRVKKENRPSETTSTWSQTASLRSKRRPLFCVQDG